MDDPTNESVKRYKNNVDTFSIIDGDGAVIDFEEKVIGEVAYIQIIQSLPNDRYKFIALALEQGFKKTEIAEMLSMDISGVSRATQTMKTLLATHYKPRWAKN